MATEPQKEGIKEVDPSMPPTPAPTSVLLYAAELRGAGAVRRKGDPIAEDEAVNLRQRGKDVVVCGNNLGVNRRQAQRIEELANGDYVRHPPHASAGRFALPHCQPATRPLNGHTFYETEHRKSVK